jgi:hypothetical protein
VSDPDLDLRSATLEELQKAGLVIPLVPEETADRLHKLQAMKGSESLWEMIVAHYRELLTSAGQKGEGGRSNKSTPIIILDGIEPRTAEDEAATPGQISFLRSLGVSDEATLNMLAKWQAGPAIEQIILTRESKRLDSGLTDFEQDPKNIGPFVLKTWKASKESKYAIWTDMVKGIPAIHGPFDKETFMGELATHLENQDRIVHLAKDGELVEGDERDQVIAEAIKLLAERKAQS